MKRLLSYFLALPMLLFCIGCHHNIEPPKPKPPKPPLGEGRTVVAYFMGTSLDYYFNMNFENMKKAVSEGVLGNNRLVIFRQRSTTSAEMGEIRYDAEGGEAVYEVVESDIDLSEPLTGRRFGEHLLSAMDYARTERYSLIMLGHSTAWLPETLLTTYARRPDEFVPSFEKMPGAEITRTIGEKRVILDMKELAEGLAFTGEKFDCIYFDVCFMSSVEAVYELRNAASYIVASPCEIMGYGSPYDLILEPLLDGDYESVCAAYYEFYKSYIWPSGCIAAIDCSKLDALADVVRRINGAAVRADFDITAVQAYEGQKRGHWFFDVLDYYSRICADTELVAELERALNDALPYRYHTDRFYSAYNAQMNDINSYSGISLTPDELCMDILSGQIKSMSDEDVRYDKLVYQLATLKYYIEPLRRMEWYGATH